LDKANFATAMLQKQTTSISAFKLPQRKPIAFCKSPLHRFSLLVFLLVCNFSNLISQNLPHQPGKILVSLYPQTNATELCRRFNAKQQDQTLESDGKVSDLLHIWLFSCGVGDEKEQSALKWLRNQPEIRFAQTDHWVEQRTTATDSLLPNDPLFYQQWQYLNNGGSGGIPNADLDAPQAWNLTTGGLTVASDTIVVAVIDGGLDFLHPDILPNLWKNYGEIPNDGIDNDNNGYVDDYLGWNVGSQNDQIATWNNTHGTPVSGIIGARGNNETGVSGVNWNVKIMFVAGSGYLSKIIESFDYIYKARKKYNDTQGQQGAFVVATNCSFGINYGTPDDAPLWCAMFDSLGQAGILSVAATANLPINVDVEGDMPTTCTSPYLIAVTSLKSNDSLASNAAWGPLSIDLGAYGNNVFTTASGNTYGAFSGTSFATPHVSGAIGLAYASNCTDLIALAKADPAAGALMAKALVLNSSVYNNSLDGKVLTDGRLNLATLALEQQTNCSSCPSPFNIQLEAANASLLVVRWLQLPGQTTTTLRWKKTSNGSWQYVTNVSSPWTISGLDTCTFYTIGLMVQCASETSAWSYDQPFETTGCCLAPTGLTVFGIDYSSAALTWDLNPGYDNYVVCWKETEAMGWNYLPVNTSSAFLASLAPCTDYMAKIGTQCEEDSFLFTAPISFSTIACGACTDLPYCEASGQSALYEWISSVKLNGWEHNSGNGGQGYQNFTNDPNNMATLPIGTPFDLELTPGFWGNPSKVYFRVYLDLNSNGSFDDPGELVYDPGYSTYNMLNATLTLSADLLPTNTRLRVVMKHMGAFDMLPVACGFFGFGQVEDYCVQIGEINSSTANNHQETYGELHSWPVPSTGEVWVSLPELKKGSSKLALDVIDAQGNQSLLKKLTPDDFKEGTIRLEAGLWYPGTYTIRLHDGEKIHLGKIIKL